VPKRKITPSMVADRLEALHKELTP
jgi:hypothetical protein